MTGGAIGNPPRNLDRELTRYLERMRQAIEKGEGHRPHQSGLDKYVKFRDLVDVGILALRGGTGTGGSSPGFWAPGPGWGGDTDGPPNMSVPPPPTGLEAHAGFKTVTLLWDDPWEVYSNHGLTEILRSTTDDPGTATVVGRSESFMWADTTVEHGLTYYYWIRFISNTDVDGPLNQVSGTQAEPAKITETDIQPDSISTPLLRVGAITADKAIIAEGAIFEAMIANAQISTAKIRDAAITSAKIRNAAITSAKIVNASITTAHIDDAAVTTLKLRGHAVTVPATVTGASSISFADGQSRTVLVTPDFDCEGGGFTALFTCSIFFDNDSYARFDLYANGSARASQIAGIRGEGSANANAHLPVALSYHGAGSWGRVYFTVVATNVDFLNGFILTRPSLTFLGTKR